jgi:uncharacterized membrane protein YdfJ with MMPL/SSD domain
MVVPTCPMGTLVAVAVALTLVPGSLAVGSRFGLFDPKRRIGVRRWRRVYRARKAYGAVAGSPFCEMIAAGSPGV